jgi:hypothetical protein
MALKVNITLTTYEHHQLLIESVKLHRSQVLIDSQAANITPLDNAELVHKARQLFTLLEEISK